MKRFVQRAVPAALLLCSIAAPARADLTADVQSKIDGAMKRAKSFVVTTQFPAQAYSSTLVYVAPDRSRVSVAISASTTDVITVGGTTYSSKNGTPFEKAVVSTEEATRLKSLGQVKVGPLHADTVVDGISYGAFETTVPLGSLVTLTCTYDKKSFRLVRCANVEVVETYASYNDPKNVIEAPNNIAEAAKGGK